MLATGLFAAVTLAGCAGSAETASKVLEDTETQIPETANNIAQGNFNIRATCGLEGNYRYGAAIPVTLNMESLKEDFEGVVRIIVPGSSYGESVPTAYEKEVLLTEGTEKIVTMAVYNSSGASTFTLQLENEKGKVVLEQSILLAGKANEDALVGVLSDDYTALNYFDKQEISLGNYDYSGKIQLVELDESTFPEQASGLDALSYLIINSYDSSRLSEGQIAAIENWVDRGGVLILGAGSDYQQTLSAFQNRMIHAAVSGMAEGTLAIDMEAVNDWQDLYEEISEPAKDTDALAFTKDAGISALSLEDGTELDSVLTQDGLVWTKEYGQGTVVVTAMNLGMEPVASWNGREFFAAWLLEQATGGYSTQRINNLNYGSYTDSYGVVSAINGLYESKRPNAGLISVLLLIFVVACPLLYLILKALDKREFLWVVIPVLAVCFTVVIFVSTGDIRINHPIESSVTILYEDTGADTGIQQTVDMALLVPDSDLTAVNLSGSLSGLKQFENYNYNFMSYMFGTSRGSNTDYNVAVRETSEGYHLGLNNGRTFQTNYFGFENTSEVDLSEGFITDFKKNVSGISGTVTNKTGYDLAGVCVFTYNRYVMIGSVANGETVSFEEKDNATLGYFDLYGTDIPGLDMYSDEYNHLVSIYTMVVDQYLSDELYYTQDIMGTYVMGYIDDWESDYVMDSTIPEYNKAVLIRKEYVGYSDYEGALIFRLFNYAEYSDDWDCNDGQMYSLTAEAKVDFGREFDQIYALVRADDSQAYYGSTANTQISAWNFKTETYDVLFQDGLIEDFEDGCPYLSEDGQMYLKFDCRTEYSDYVPEITVVGGVE